MHGIASRRAALSGALLFVSTAIPGGWLLVWVALAPWLTGVRDWRHGRDALQSGAVLGLVFWGLNLSWMLVLAARLGAAWPVAAFVGQLLLLSLISGGAGALIWRLSRRLPLPLAAAGGWMAVEWARGALLGPLNFPWSPVALPLTGALPWIQPAAWVGEWGLGFGVVLANGVVALAAANPGRSTYRSGDAVPDPRTAAAFPSVSRSTGGAWTLLALALAFWGGAGWLRMQGAAPMPVLSVAAVQPAIPLDLGRPGPTETAEALAALEELLPRVGEVDVVVLPETLFPQSHASAAAVGEPLWEDRVDTHLQVWAHALDAVILAGAYTAAPGSGAANAVVAVRGGSGGEDVASAAADRPRSHPRPSRPRYEKTALVPGVEWVPGLPGRGRGAAFDEAGPREGGRPSSGVSRGRVTGPLSSAMGAAPLICIESAWSRVAARHARAGGRWIVNITNDAWLAGEERWTRTFAFRQHSRHLQLRSAETGLGALRVGNTGLTGRVTPLGAWEPLLAPHTPGAAQTELAALEGATLYVRIGHRLPATASLALLLVGVAAGLRERLYGSAAAGQVARPVAHP